MNKHSKHFTLLAVMLILSLLLTACSGGSSSLKKDIVGDWDSPEFVNAFGAGSTDSLGLTVEKMWIRFSEDKMIIIADGEPLIDKIKPAASNLGLPEDQVNAMLSSFEGFPYSIDGNKMKITIGTETQDLTVKIEGDKLLLTAGDETITLTKHK